MAKTNARNTVASAASKAQATKSVSAEDMVAATIAAMSPEQIAAILAAKGVKMDAPKADEKPAIDATKFVGKIVKVIGGRKQKDFEGQTFKAYHATKGSQLRKPSILAEGKDTLTAGASPVFLNPAYLEIVGDMQKADLDRLQAMQKAQTEETLYVVAFTRGDKAVTDTSIRLSNKGWVKDVWFALPKGDSAGMIFQTGAETPDGEKIFEVAAWKIRKELGMDTFNAIKAQQTELEKLVNAA